MVNSQPIRAGPLQTREAFRQAAVYASWPIPLLMIAGFATATVTEGISIDFIPCALAALLLWTGYAVTPRFPRSATLICMVGLGFLGLTALTTLKSAWLLLSVSMENGAQTDLFHRLLLAGGIALLPVPASLLLRDAGQQFSVQRLAHPAACTLWVVALLVLLSAWPSTISHPRSFAWALGCWGISLDLLAGSVLACIRGIGRRATGIRS